MLLACLLSLGTLSMSAQSVTATFSSTPLATAIKTVCDKAGYKVNFSGEDMGRYTVTCTLNNTGVDAAMSKVLSGKPYSYRVEGKQVIVSKKSTEAKQDGEGQIVKGRIVDETGEPLIGANVILKGDAYQGCTTNANGEFSLGLGKNHAYSLICTYMDSRSRPSTLRPATATWWI